MSRHKKVGRKRISDWQRKKNQAERFDKWRKEKTTALSIRLVNGKDDDIRQHLDSLTISKSEYIKTLIRNDIKKD